MSKTLDIDPDIEKHATSAPITTENSLSPPTTIPKCPAQTSSSSFKQLSFLDRFLALWILFSMALGLLLGYFIPSVSPALQKGSFVSVSIPIAIGLLVMMYPILIKVRYESLPAIFRHRELWKHLFFSVLINWLIAPLLMVGLAWACLPDKPELREGLILVGIARCIAMVLVWTQLAAGDNEYCALLVAVNSGLQMVLFAPLAVFYIRVVSGGSVDVDYETVATSVAVFLGIPLAAAVVTRFLVRGVLLSGDEERWQRHFVRWIAPWSLIGLLFTIIVLFASQARNIAEKVVEVVRVAVPLLVYFVVVFAVVLAWARWRGWPYGKTVTQCLTAASNNFELAIAVAVACYGAASSQALAATVGPLIEVPVLLALVEVMKWVARKWKWEEK
ncbi:arsenical-resistance protein [Ascodesmis nigricans]|uniref:Arsenical-resistance protein n=1 Tax=Ascodesmis nigricans TaxID=341454 RepID=A0A4S2MID6_9PEZI|nr:arsenical-resistance protein [Ascodesmis nigricans]